MAILPDAPSAAEKPPTVSMSRRALFDLVWSKPLTVIAEDLSITRNGLAKVCDRLLIPYPGRGYWSKPKAVRQAGRPSLPPAPELADETVSFSSDRSVSRRPRTRMARTERSEQLIEAVGLIIAREGLHAATMKRVAREVGISEAQAHNHFSRRADLLLALARRELEAMNAVRESEIERADDSLSRVTASTVAYLRQVAERGALIQVLSNSPEVRAGLRAERQAQAGSARRRMTEQLNSRYGVANDTAYGATVILTALCLRAGRLLAEHKVSLELAERLSLAIVTAGNRSLMASTRALRAASGAN
ncbi:MAG TPA: TetR family transcriptional regulator [Phenylobacterium sp.]|nr:TetR family transcriptional regulator [Phenylobacterium sp.]